MKKITSYLNNLGIINALGATKEDVIANLLANKQTNMVVYDELFSGNKTYVGKVVNTLKEIPQELAKFNCRNNQLIMAAYASIADDVEYFKTKYGLDRVGVILGTSTSGIASGEIAFKHYMQHGCFPKEFAYTQQEIGNGANFLAQYAGVTGTHYTISTACSSSSKAFVAADRLIKADLCDMVIVGGADSLCEMTLNGFDSLELLSPSICNPFSVNRAGINIGEGAALFVLSKEAAPIKLIGGGEASDGYHVTAPDPSGAGAKLAITQALQTAKINPDDVGYINLHGTGTNKNDAMESLVINDLFTNMPYCSSTKPLTGHTLGAAGAQGIGLCWLLLAEEHNSAKLLPPQVWDGQQDPQLPAINLIAAPTKWDKPIFMCNTFAFGGNNVCLLIAKED